MGVTLLLRGGRKNARRDRIHPEPISDVSAVVQFDGIWVSISASAGAGKTTLLVGLHPQLSSSQVSPVCGTTRWRYPKSMVLHNPSIKYPLDHDVTSPFILLAEQNRSIA